MKKLFITLLLVVAACATPVAADHIKGVFDGDVVLSGVFCRNPEVVLRMGSEMISPAPEFTPQLKYDIDSMCVRPGEAIPTNVIGVIGMFIGEKRTWIAVEVLGPRGTIWYALTWEGATQKRNRLSV